MVSGNQRQKNKHKTSIELAMDTAKKMQCKVNDLPAEEFPENAIMKNAERGKNCKHQATHTIRP